MTVPLIKRDSSKCIIGVDFDNTIIGYDTLFHKLACARGWGGAGLAVQKKEVRDYVRTLNDGELKWQKLQALAYGPEIGGAILTDGVMEFFARCRLNGVPTYIISHKTEFASQSEGPINMCECAVDWLTEQGFLSGETIVIDFDRIFFEETRLQKIDRIKQLGCTHFIDDLEELLNEPSFPVGVEKIHYSPVEKSNLAGVISVSSWQEISDYFFPSSSPSY